MICCREAIYRIWFHPGVLEASHGSFRKTGIMRRCKIQNLQRRFFISISIEIVVSRKTIVLKYKATIYGR